MIWVKPVQKQSAKIGKHDLASTCGKKVVPHNSCNTMLLLPVVTVSICVTIGCHFIFAITGGSLPD